MRMPSTRASVSVLVGRPAALEQDAHALHHLLLEAVIEVVVHLLHQFLVVEGLQIEFGVLIHYSLSWHASGTFALLAGKLRFGRKTLVFLRP
jgi:hypothetical protein